MEIHVIPLAWLRRMGIPNAALLHVSAFASAALVVLLAPLLKFVPHFCLAKKLLHIPCPGCGITNGLLALLHLDFAASWHANPACIVFALFLLFTLTMQPIAMLWTGSRTAVRSISQHMSCGVTIVLLMVWVARLL